MKSAMILFPTDSVVDWLPCLVHDMLILRYDATRKQSDYEVHKENAHDISIRFYLTHSEEARNLLRDTWEQGPIVQWRLMLFLSGVSWTVRKLRDKRLDRYIKPVSIHLTSVDSLKSSVPSERTKLVVTIHLFRSQMTHQPKYHRTNWSSPSHEKKDSFSIEKPLSHSPMLTRTLVITNEPNSTISKDGAGQQCPKPFTVLFLSDHDSI